MIAKTKIRIDGEQFDMWICTKVRDSEGKKLQPIVLNNMPVKNFTRCGRFFHERNLRGIPLRWFFFFDVDTENGRVVVKELEKTDIV